MKISKNNPCIMDKYNTIYTIKRVINLDKNIYYIFAGLLSEELIQLLKELQETKKPNSKKFNILKNIIGFDFDYICNLILKEETVIINDII